ncbi:RPM1-interacting protein 4-like isoform X2 [Typha latifolia]|uniref:RPM1-interacting protein 4-like isoform X2 n=1 Tax=Typha latifolia TaxID=4733 RepID=UPI003C2E9425
MELRGPRISKDKGRPLPKFGEWDVNDPASAEGFTVIFNKARDEKKTGGNAQESDLIEKEDRGFKHGPYPIKSNSFSCYHELL